ncbi:GK18154 [Syncephalis plumigaleata]|nr:GK18154 [Syncephalis plumigaleata]
MEVNEQNLQVLAQYLGQTLDPALRREAEQFLQSAEKNAGFPLLTLTLIVKEDADPNIRFAAALLLKNFVKRHWSVTEGQDSIAPSDRQAIKANIVDVLVKVSPKIQVQIGEVIATIADNDFPADWADLVPNLVSKLNPQDYTINNGILKTVHMLFKGWRHAFASDAVFSEIKYVIGIFGQPFLELVLNTDQLIDKNAQDAAALQTLLESMFLSAKVFYNLNSQDLPEFFEDHMTEFMTIFHKYLLYTNPIVETQDPDEAGPLEKLRASICEIVDLYAKRYAEEFKMLQDFITIIWTMLTKLSLEPKNDILMCRALSFLATVVKLKETRDMFGNEQTMKEICEKLVLQNMSMRESDEELIEDEPVVFVRRDLEGTESDTRRKAATDLVQALQEQFAEQTTNIITLYITQFLQRYAENPTNNWRDKDIAIYLLTSIAARSTSQGAINTSQFVDVASFFSGQVLPDLQAPANSVHPVLQMDAIKFVNTFRHQLTKEQWLSVLPMLAERLGSEHVVVYTYAAIAIERMLTVKSGQNVPTVAADDIKPFTDTLLTKLFAHLEKSQSPEKLAENEFLMKAILRILVTIRGELPQPTLIMTKLVTVIEAVSTNPSNPRFNHYTFEAVSALLRAGPAALPALEEQLTPTCQSILQRDVTEFIPYVIQLISLMLELHSNVPPAYAAMLPPFLQPTLWEVQGNVPALTRLVKAYIAKDIGGIFDRGQLNQSLVYSRSLMLPSLMINMDLNCCNRYLLMHQKRMTNYFPAIIRFIKEGPDATIKVFEAIQPRLFVNIANSVIIPTLNIVALPRDCKLCAVGYTRLLTQSTAIVHSEMANIWPALFKALVTIFTSNRALVVPSTEEENYELEESVGFQAAFSKLGAASQPVEDPFATITDPRLFLAVHLQQFNSQHPNVVNYQCGTRLDDADAKQWVANLLTAKVA